MRWRTISKPTKVRLSSACQSVKFVQKSRLSDKLERKSEKINKQQKRNTRNMYCHTTKKKKKNSKNICADVLLYVFIKC